MSNYIPKFWLNTFINIGEGFVLVSSVPLNDKPNSKAPVPISMAKTHAELMELYALLKSGDEEIITQSLTVRVTIRRV